jgi:hypothetical protein
MKKLIAIATLALSVNAFSASFVGTTLLPTQSLTSVSTSGNVQNEAAQVINDSQELIQSGKMTAFLGQKIKDIQAQDSSVSDSEALDALLSVSEHILK